MEKSCLKETRHFLQEPDVQKYITECVKLGLFMYTTDPPVCLECTGWTPRAKRRTKDCTYTGENNGTTTDGIRTYQRDAFNNDKYKGYTETGRFKLFTVWPVLLLHDKGPVLNKGVAQGTKEEFGRENYIPWKWWK